LTLGRLASARGDHYFVIRILNIGFQITRLPMHQRMAAVIDFFALVKGFAIWHARYLRDNRGPFHPLKPRAGVSQMLTSTKNPAEISAFCGGPTGLRQGWAHANDLVRQTGALPASGAVLIPAI
jgi:hypothetical protein